ITTTAGFNAATCPGATIATETPNCFNIIQTITIPNSNIKFDGNSKAPYTDQYAVGLDRELAHNIGLGVNVVHKRAGNQLGWTDIGGVYGTQNVNVTGTTIYGEQVNQVLTVFPRLSPAAQSVFLRTNGKGFYSEYNAVMFTVTKRLANRWQFTGGYTRQRA